jgi:hypothetical protein
MIAITVLGGVAEPVARFIGQKLGAAVEPVMYPDPGAYLQSFGKGEWDIAVGPRVLAPADKADSTADLWVISLVYVAAPGKEFPDIASVDKVGVKVGTILGAPSGASTAFDSLIRTSEALRAFRPIDGRGARFRPAADPGAYSKFSSGCKRSRERACGLNRPGSPAQRPVSSRPSKFASGHAAPAVRLGANFARHF